jgi:hypothetical protein
MIFYHWHFTCSEGNTYWKAVAIERERGRERRLSQVQVDLRQSSTRQIKLKAIISIAASINMGMVRLIWGNQSKSRTHFSSLIEIFAIPHYNGRERTKRETQCLGPAFQLFLVELSERSEAVYAKAMRNYFSLGSFTFTSFWFIQVLKYKSNTIELGNFVLVKLFSKA